MCLYSGAEFIDEAKNEHIREIDDVKTAIVEEKMRLEKITHKANRLIFTIIIAIVSLFILILIVKWIPSYISASSAIVVVTTKGACRTKLYKWPRNASEVRTLTRQ